MYFGPVQISITPLQSRRFQKFQNSFSHFINREFKQRRRLRLRQRHKATIWLVKKGKTIVLHVQHEFPHIFCRTPQNKNEKSPDFRFWRQREHITMKSNFQFWPVLTRWTRRNNREIALSYILDWRFRCRSSRVCLNSLILFTERKIRSLHKAQRLKIEYQKSPHITELNWENIRMSRSEDNR